QVLGDRSRRLQVGVLRSFGRYREEDRPQQQLLCFEFRGCRRLLLKFAAEVKLDRSPASRGQGSARSAALVCGMAGAFAGRQSVSPGTRLSGRFVNLSTATIDL